MSPIESTLSFVFKWTAIMIDVYMLEVSAAKLTESMSNLVCTLVALSALGAVFMYIKSILRNIRKCIIREEKGVPITYFTNDRIGASLITYAVLLVARSLYLSLFDLERSLILILLAFVFAIFFIVVTYKNLGMPSSAVIISASYLTFVSAVLILALTVTPGMLHTASMMALIVALMVIISATLNLMSLTSKEKINSEIFVHAIESRSDILDQLQIIDEIAQESFAENETECYEKTEEQVGNIKNKDKIKISEIHESSGSSTERECVENSPEVIMDDLSHHVKLIDECVNFLLSNNSNSVFYR